MTKKRTDLALLAAYAAFTTVPIVAFAWQVKKEAFCEKRFNSALVASGYRLLPTDSKSGTKSSSPPSTKSVRSI